MPTINLATLRVKLTAENAEYQEKVQQSKKTTQDHAKVFETAIAGAAATAFAIATKAVIDFTRQSSEEFKQFDRQVREVYTLLPSLSRKATDQMSADMLDFDTAVGRLSDETVPALYQAISAGISDDNVFQFLETASDAALGGVTELETAVDGISSVMNAYGQDVISAAQASDLMFTAVKGGKTTFDELSRSLFQVIPTAASLQLEFGNVTAALATMTAQGTPTTVATTQLRQLLVELSKDGSEAAVTFERLAGQSFTEFIAKGGNLQGALQIMEQGAADANLRLSDMFGSVEAGQAALALTGAGASKFTQELENAANASGATEEAAAIMNDSLEHQAALASAAKEQLMILIGEGLEPAQRKWLELQRVIAETGIEYIKEARAKEQSYEAGSDIIAQLEQTAALNGRLVDANGESADSYYATQDAIMAVNAAFDPWTGSVEDAELNTRALEIANQLLIDGFAGTGQQLGELAVSLAQTSDATEAAQGADQERLDTLTALYRQQNDIVVVTDDQTDANRKAETAVSNLARAEGLHAVDISRATAEYEAQQRQMEEVAAAREEFIAQFEAYGDIIDSVRSPVEELMTAEADLAAAQGEWVTTYVDTSGQVAELSQQLSFDLSDDQKRAYQDILGTVEEGSAEWLGAYNALQNDLSASQRASIVAQIADLQAGNGEIVSVYTGNASAAEEAQGRINTANAAISASYRQAALDIALTKIAEQYGEDALAAQQAAIAVQVGLGTITQEQGDKLLEIAEKTDAITTATSDMLDVYLEDGQLTAQEIGNIAAAVDLIEQSSINSDTAMRVLAENGITNLSQVETGAQNVETAFFGAKEEVGELKNNIWGLPDEKTIDVYINVHGAENLPDGGGGSGGSSGGAGGGAGDNTPYATGGFTGYGSTADIAGLVHKNEYVFNADSVSALGLDFLDGLHTAAQGGAAPMSGGGDGNVTIVANTREAMALAMAQAAQIRRSRLDAWMGVE